MITTIAVGLFAVVAAIGSIWLKSYFDQNRPAEIDGQETIVNPFASPAVTEFTESEPGPSFRKRAAELYRRGLLLPAYLVVGSTLLGIVSRLVRPYAQIGQAHFDAMASLAILSATCLALVIHHRREPGILGHLRFQFENVVLWASFACGWSLIEGQFWEDLIILCIGSGVISSALGSIVLAILHRRFGSVAEHRS